MNRFAFLRVAALALVVGLGGCAIFEKSIDNPVTPVTIYQVKNLYGATLTGAVEWRTYCWARPYAVLMADPIAKPICQNRRSTVRKIQVARPKAATAIKIASDFQRDNPQLSAASAISAAYRAVTDFRNVLPQVPQ